YHLPLHSYPTRRSSDLFAAEASSSSQRSLVAAMRSAALHRLVAVAGRTQEALYAEIDLELSWSEDDLPQVERTKHVHSVHPYLRSEEHTSELQSLAYLV